MKEQNNRSEFTIRIRSGRAPAPVLCAQWQRRSGGDRALLYPIRHGSEEAQQDLLRIKLRDSLVRARVALINSVRFSLKSLGYAVSNPSSERFHKVAMESLPEVVREMIAPSVQALAELSARIAVLEREISLLARTKYPQTLWLQQVLRSRSNHGALLCVEDRRPEAF